MFFGISNWRFSHAFETHWIYVSKRKNSERFSGLLTEPDAEMASAQSGCWFVLQACLIILITIHASIQKSQKYM